ncbi:hypothetical protein ACJ6WD_09905 [Streptomyces sp. VTCC 41912]|uniref:hypothetical protein n=1 Tax=Streptomyces sp. VTCC 41912 TaxID=3383243 RepID=UPI003896BEFC
MYEIPKKRAVRRAVTREDVEAERMTDWLIDIIENDPEVRAAILRVVAGGQTPRRPRPTTTQPVRRGRGR